MSASHICIRSALTQAFRPSTCTLAASWSVPEFLVPSLSFARRPRRAFSSAKRRRAHAGHPAPQSNAPILNSQREQPIYHLNHHGKPHEEPLRSRITFPDGDASRDMQEWLATIDPFLPPQLRRQPSNDADISTSVTPFDLAAVLDAAQHAGLDIVSYVGLVEQRWDTVVWIAKKLVEDGKSSSEGSVQLESAANVLWPELEPRSLDDLTESPLLTQRARPPRKLKYTLEDLTSIPESLDIRRRVIKRGVGQLWRSLGNMILVAAGNDNPPADNSIMPRVLEIIAYLHHTGLIPDSVYTYRSNQDAHALQQPPTLHLLSSKILTALSDATWRAHEASVKVATERLNASYFLGHEIPGSRYKVQVTEIAPELWLELVLWSCLHGGWILDGSSILEQIVSDPRQHDWRLISWAELLQAKDEEQARTSGWGLFQRERDAFTKAEDRAQTQRTISSEVVTAFVDGLVNNMRLAVGGRGTAPEVLVERIKNLKHFLDLNSLSLGSTTWDSIISRLLESGGIVPEKRPELLLSILNLASGFGTEVSAVNALPKAISDVSEPPYFFEPTTMALSLLHRTIRAFIHNGDMAGAMTTLKMLQSYTDSNMQRSLEQFFETLKSVPLPRDEPFTSRVPPIEFPAFQTQLPLPLLAKLLDLATDSKQYDIGRWLLFSKDLDGPLIDPDVYGHFSIAAAIIRFGTLAGENDLVLKTIEWTGTWDKDSETQRMPHEFFTALLCGQITLHRWQSVRGMQEYALESSGYRPSPMILATFGAELVRISSAATQTQQPEKDKALHAFRDFLFVWENLILTDVRNEFYCVVGILSTIDDELKQYCSQFLKSSASQGIKLSTRDFNQILGGVLDVYGSSKGRELVDMWCYQPSRMFEPYRAPGGLPTMAKYRVDQGKEYEDRPQNIEVGTPSGTKVTLRGRIYPNRQTVWIILRKMQEEEAQRQAQRAGGRGAPGAEVGETLKWAARLLYYLGYDYEDIIRDLGSLAEKGELEAPPARRWEAERDEEAAW